jgi:hypothetical protein
MNFVLVRWSPPACGPLVNVGDSEVGLAVSYRVLERKYAYAVEVQISE